MTPACIRHHRARAARGRAPGLALVCLWLGAPTAAAQSSPWYLAASTSLAHESNLLRLADAQAPLAGESRSDTVLSTALVGGLNQGLGRQRLTGSLTLRDNRFDHNGKYDNQSYNGSLGLNWSTVERVSGVLAMSAARNLSTFNADGVGLLSEKNLETTRAVNGSVSVGLVTQYSFELGAGQRQVRNSAADERVLARDFNQDTLSAGLTWRPSGALNLAATLRTLRALYPTFRTTAAGVESDRYQQQQTELVAGWQATGASTLDARVTFGDTRYRVNEERNFSGVNGSLSWLWQTTGKLRLTTRYSRDKGQDAYPTTTAGVFQGLSVGSVPATLNDQRVISTLRLQSDLDLSPKLALVASVQQARRTIVRNTFVPAGLDAPLAQSGRDRTTLWTLGGRWAPLRSALLGCDAASERRRASGDLSANLKSASLSCFGQFTLQ